ncbi:hypothetical protein ACFWQG_13045 [Rhodococcus sp. NPDC058532]|uniref:hypothetical protein n=1 Tax=Rhodococcus sp. NPDC058532 TaxID=3346540 RepID=UPI00365EB886
MPPKKLPDNAFTYTTTGGVDLVLPPLSPTFGQLRRIRHLNDFSQFATLVEEIITDGKVLDQLDAVPSEEIGKLRDAWFKHSQALELGE